MKIFASTQTCTQNNVKEHSPIYDLQAYALRQRSAKRKKLLKNLIDTTIFFSAIIFTFSMLFWEI
ncbi:hypothetical protein [Acinetobacter guillouiae]|uniref:hypothetical protein n=1 Tax=Acinetobacter guillouiae TaxID=106649 RepID=UPI0028D8CDC7|nr:hypothetical protein [Acinetobacter guillouiae]